MMSNTDTTVTGHSRCTSGDTLDDFKRDTRRDGILVHAQIAEGISFIYPDEEDEDDNGTYTDFESSWEFTPVSPDTRQSKLSDTTQTTAAQQIAKKYSVRPTGTSEAQQIVQDYLRKRGENIEVKQPTVIRTDKELPTIPDHRNSAYTLAVTDDGRSMIDLEKRPEPAIRLFHYDREGLAQAHQGMEMIQAVGCTPRGNIRCQRPGCTDVLRDLEALKFHLHIHNIGDFSNAMSIISAHSQRTKENRHICMESSPQKNPTRKAHNRSKSSIEIDVTSCQSHSTHRARRSHAKGPSSLPSDRNPSITHVNSSALHSRTNVPLQSRGRRSNRGTFQNGLSEAGYNDSIAMVLSRPTSPISSSQEVLGSKMDPPLSFVNYKSSFSPPASPGRAEKEFLRTKSPKRAFSPARALSPIRDGLRRVLSLGRLNEWKCSQ